MTWTDRKMVRRINALIEDIQRGSEGGIGKPELLSGSLTGFASRRINEEHRLVYRAHDHDIDIVQCRSDYEK